MLISPIGRITHEQIRIPVFCEGASSLFIHLGSCSTRQKNCRVTIAIVCSCIFYNLRVTREYSCRLSNGFRVKCVWTCCSLKALYLCPDIENTTLQFPFSLMAYYVYISNKQDT